MDEPILDEGNQEESLEDNLTEPEEEILETEEEEEEKVETEKPKQNYTAEELRTLDFEKLDTSRIPPEQQAVYKSLQSGYNKKFQELAEERKAVEKERIEATKPATFEAYYAQNPNEAIKHLNDRIIKLQEEGDTIEAQRVQNYKETLARETYNTREQQNLEQQAILKQKTELIETIPDYLKKVDKLKGFAQETFGFTEEEWGFISNPVDNVTSRIIRGVNKLYDRFNVPTGKEKKPLPLSVESPGSAKEVKSKSFKTMNDDDFEKEIAKAKYS